MEKYFKMYKITKNQLDHYARVRGTSFGIMVDNDTEAKNWQGIRMRLELLDAKLENRQPNWAFAKYLTIEERDRRNETRNTLK